MQKSRFFPYMVVFAGVLVASTAAIMIRLAQMEGVPSLVVAFWRLGFASAVLTPLVWSQQRNGLRALNRRLTGWALLAGVFLALHLATWIESLNLTSVASSVVLVTTNPLWVALIVWLLYRERLSRYSMIGLVITFSGSILITLSDAGILRWAGNAIWAWEFNGQALLSPQGAGGTALLGNSLALIGAITGAMYLIVGRSLRRELSTLLYVWLVYTTAAVVMLIWVLLAGLPLMGYGWLAFGWMLLLALGPQLLGHTAFNWSLAHLSATFVALAILGEPIGSSLLAYVLFGETFSPLQLVGFVSILLGIALGIRGEERQEPVRASPAESA